MGSTIAATAAGLGLIVCSTTGTQLVGGGNNNFNVVAAAIG